MNQQTFPKKYDIAVVIPFIDSWEITSTSLNALANLGTANGQLIIIDNGSSKSYKKEIKEMFTSSSYDVVYIKNKINTGVLATFKQGINKSDAPITCFLHNDVLIHDSGWDKRVLNEFNNDAQLGLAGLFGARAVHPDGGREGSMSNMQGKTWGGCNCHPVASVHHGESMTETFPAAVFDGVGLFFRSTVLKDLETGSDLFDNWRAPHHFYDRIMSLKVLERGYHMKVIGIQFDHYSGATANHSEEYVKFCKKWLKEQNQKENSVGLDDTIYWIAEGQWRKEYAHRLPVYVSPDYSVRWTA